MSEKTRPIIMSGWSVQRILTGEKTQTRRPIKHAGTFFAWKELNGNAVNLDTGEIIICPYGKPGDLLWVRETWAEWKGDIFYKAEGHNNARIEETCGWKPSIFMPRWVSRITLRIKDIRVERLKDITNKDCAAEGCRPLVDDTGIYDERVEFCELWDSIYVKTFPWESNPYVWARDFIREEI